MPKKELVEVEEKGQIVETGKYIPRMTLKEMKKVLKEELEKREYLLDFIKKQLKPGIDFGMIHKKIKVKPREYRDCKYKDQEILKDDKDELIWQCSDCKSKYELRKPGAEKICGFLQLKPKFEVDRDAMEMLGMMGKGIIYICYLITESGERASEGYEGRGARTLEQDKGDLNKCVKMAKKSAHIDATLTIKGLSAIFTQDITDLAIKSPEDWDEPKPEKSELAKEKPYILPETLSIEEGNKIINLTLSRFFKELELNYFQNKRTPIKKIKKELAHRNHFTFAYKPQSPSVYSLLSKTKKKCTEEEWKEKWNKEKRGEFAKASEIDQKSLIGSFAEELKNAKK